MSMVFFCILNFYVIYAIEIENNSLVGFLPKALLMTCVSCLVLASIRLYYLILGQYESSRASFVLNKLVAPLSSSLLITPFYYEGQIFNLWWVYMLVIITSYDSKNKIPLFVWRNRESLLKRFANVDRIEDVSRQSILKESLTVYFFLVLPLVSILLSIIYDALNGSA